MNNIKINFMKKIFFALLALSMCFVSCKSSGGSVNKEDNAMQIERKPIGVWKAMEWTSSDRIEKENSVVKVNVPAAKNTVELNCKTYSNFWISSVNGESVANSDNKSFKGEFFEIKCEGNKLLVSFDANTIADRTLDLTIQGGDIFSKLNFNQKAE